MRDDSEGERERRAATVSEMRFRKAMAEWPAGVAVVAADDGENAHGLTVSSFTSVSLAPPQCLVCVNTASPLLPILRRAKRFAAHILTEDQADLAMIFAGSDAAARAQALIRSDAAAPPTLAVFQIRFVMRLRADWTAGDHAVLVGEVEAIDAPRVPLPDGAPQDLGDSSASPKRALTWWRSRLGSLMPRGGETG